MGKQARPDQVDEGPRFRGEELTLPHHYAANAMREYYRTLRTTKRERYAPAWKSNFRRITRTTNVPIVPIFIDYPTKTFPAGFLIETTGDTEANMTRIRATFAGYRGKHRTA